MLDFNAFELIRGALAAELETQGFSPPVAIEDEKGRAEMLSTEDVAYSLLYDRKGQRFELRSTTLKAPGEPGDWRSLSLWLFDERDGTRADAESIINDFLDVVRGPKRVAIVQQKKKRGKDDERNVDPLFFYNRLVNIFPELKDEMNQEKIVYGQVRYCTFAKASINPKVEDLCGKYPDSEPVKKLAALLDDMYKSGDLDVRSILTFVILNSMSDGTYRSLEQELGDDLKKAAPACRRLRNKNIKPEKKKNEKKVEARLR